MFTPARAIRFIAALAAIAAIAGIRSHITQPLLAQSVDTELIADDFSLASLDGTKWRATSLMTGAVDTSIIVAAVDQQLSVGPLKANTTGSHYAGVVSQQAFDFTGAYAYVELVQSAASTSAYTMFDVGNGSTAYYRWWVSGSTLTVERNLGTKQTRATFTYDPAVHRFLRIRNVGNDVVFDTAPGVDGIPGTWTERWREAWDPTVDMAAIKFELKAGTSDATSAPGSALFDNFRAAVPPYDQLPIISLTDSSGGSYSDPATLHLAATASDPDGSIDHVTFYSNGIAIDTVSSAPYTLTWSNVPEGSYDLTAVATDNQGAAASSSPVSVVVSAPLGGQSLLSDDFDATTIDSVKWHPGALLSGSVDATIEVSQPNQRLTVGPLKADTTSSHYNGIVSQQAYDFTGAYAYVELVQPAANGSYTMFTLGSGSAAYYRWWVNGPTLTVETNVGSKQTRATLSYDPALHRFLRIRNVGSDVVFDTAPGVAGVPGAWTEQWREAWNPVVNTAAIKFELKAGTSDAIAMPGSAQYDTFRAAVPGSNQAPSIAIDAPANGATFTVPGSIELRGDAQDVDGTIVGVSYYDGSAFIGSASTAPFEFTWMNASVGQHQLTAEASDNSGNVSVSLPVTVSVLGSGAGPTISADVTPAANDAGWHNTGVTVAFSCTATATPVQCPTPVDIGSEGSDIPVSGTATDSAGATTTTSIALNIDKTAPAVVIDGPADGLTTAESYVRIIGHATDALSGSPVVACDGAAGIVAADGAFVCEVGLVAGDNTVAVVVSDRAGNSSTAQLSVTRTVTPTTSLVMSPNSRTLLVGDMWRVNIRNQNGEGVSDVSWTSNDEGVATVEIENGASVVTAHGVGDASLIAHVAGASGELTASLHITVAAGDALPVGAVKWSFAPEQSWITSSLPAASHQGSDSAEQFVFAQSLATGESSVYALNGEGEALWVASVPSDALHPFADASGGITTTYGSYSTIEGIRRLGPSSGGTSTWDYQPSGWLDGQIASLGSRAIAQDGNGAIYHLQYNEAPSTSPRTISMVAVDGATGIVRNTFALPSSHDCQSGTTAPSFTPILAGSDGAGYVAALVSDTCTTTSGSTSSTDSWHVDVFRMSSAGEVSQFTVREGDSTQECDTTIDTPTGCRGTLDWGDVYDIEPDGDGGLLVFGYGQSGDAATDEYLNFNWIRRYHDGNITDWGGVANDFSYVGAVGQDSSVIDLGYADTAIVRKWTAGGRLEWTTPASDYETPLAVLADGGVALYDTSTGLLTNVDAAGVRSMSQPLPIMSDVAKTDDAEVTGVIGTAWTATPAVVKVVTAARLDLTAWPSTSGQNAARSRSWPSVAVNCRPLQGALGLLADHCYVVARESASGSRYIESGPDIVTPSWNRAFDAATVSPSDSRAVVTWRGAPVKVADAAVVCVRDAVETWNLSHVEYNPVGPNSNTFVSWLVHECQVPARPSIFARAVGWIEY